jgi:serralysin
VFRLCQVTLNRIPDREGLNAWAKKLATRQAYWSIAAGFTNSAEFQNSFNAFESAAFVRQLYAKMLDS